ncbi:MAG: aminoacyl-tRNA hydrolase [Verrucomicrobia bacterium]|nr:aminoacyl-tRNA hydrolase [Verrucomicrobiota bacterium]
MEKRRVLIVGLGNPGSRYETTRHNAGHILVGALAKSLGFSLKKDSMVEGKVAVGVHKEVEIALLMPTTYMNLSGGSVKKAMHEYTIATEDLLVISDDVYVPFGSFRLREKGSSGGHNGLKSIEGHLGTQEFARLRVGVGAPFSVSLEEYVLSDFTEQELEEIPRVINHGIALIDFWIQRDMGAANGFIASITPTKNVGE